MFAWLNFDGIKACHAPSATSSPASPPAIVGHRVGRYKARDSRKVIVALGIVAILAPVEWPFDAFE